MASLDDDPSSSSLQTSLKRRRGRPLKHNKSSGDREETPLSYCRRVNKKKNGRPAELYRTDLITIMKVNENDTTLDKETYMIIGDSWRQDWNQGVQIPVDSTSIPKVEYRKIGVGHSQIDALPQSTFHFPHKLIFTYKTGLYNPNRCNYVQTARKADNQCRYDLDDFDVQWLLIANERRTRRLCSKIGEVDMERVLERLENDCYDALQKLLVKPPSQQQQQQQQKQQQGREFDVNSACDICLSVESEPEDEIVFCDGCDLCVHQSCYGVAVLPVGQWLCRSCAISPGKPTQCVLCPNSGGALKCTRSGERWAHVSCVLWIPEVRFGDPEMLEPVINLANIPDDRWLLRCSVCNKKQGACIQCSVKNCRIAYHVTCAQRNRHFIKYTHCESTEGVRLVSYCEKHSDDHNHQSLSLRDGQTQLNSLNLSYEPPSSSIVVVQDHHFDTHPHLIHPESPRKRKARLLVHLERSFYRHVDLDSVTCSLGLPVDLVSDVYEYWKLKRRSNNDRPLLTSKDDEDSMLERYEEEALIRKVRMLVALRQNLEKARNLCYMVVRREKHKRHYLSSVDTLFSRLNSIMNDHGPIGQPSQRELDRFSAYLQPTTSYDSSAMQQLVEDAVRPVCKSPIIVDEATCDINSNKLNVTHSTSSSRLPIINDHQQRPRATLKIDGQTSRQADGRKIRNRELARLLQTETVLHKRNRHSLPVVS